MEYQRQHTESLHVNLSRRVVVIEKPNGEEIKTNLSCVAVQQGE